MEMRSIIISNDYKPQIKQSISSSDAFLEQYRIAADTLEDILRVYNSINKKDDNGYKEIEFPNNIIAFCGERGDGKTSMLLSFMNLLCKYKSDKNSAKELFADKTNINRIIFADEIYVDPSALDGVHNILDLLVAKMFKNFRQSIENNKWKNDIAQQQNLLKSFQVVYRLISIVKDSKKILDNEFDYEGSVEKLSSLSDSMRLKEELTELVSQYNDYMNKGTGDTVIPILIDDLDMSFSYAYTMAEQIRKFLIIPGIVIILSVRIKQLLYCIKEYNISQLSWQVNKMSSLETDRELANMSSNYLSKLIPLAHRVNLPKVQDIHNVNIDYNGNKYSLASLSILALQKIYQKTGMVFVLGENLTNRILPNNFRDMVSFIGFMELLPNFSEEDREYEIQYDNICHFFDFYSKELFDNIKYLNRNKINLFEQLFYIDINTPKAAADVIRKIYDTLELYPQDVGNTVFNYYTYQSMPWGSSFCYLMNIINYMNNNCYNEIGKKCIEIIKLFYTVKLNKIKVQNKIAKNNFNYEDTQHCLASFTGTTIWGYGVYNVIPVHRVGNSNILLQRTRFDMNSIDVFNCIAQELNLPSTCFLKSNYIAKTKIDSFEEKRKYIVAWLLFVVLVNNYDLTNNNNINNNSNSIQSINGWAYLVFDNSMLIQFVQVSIENVLVRFSMLSELVELLNIDILGISENEIQDVVKYLSEKNSATVEMSELIVCNVDLIQTLLNIPLVRYNKKADEVERTKKLVEKFLMQINNKMRKMEDEYGYNFVFSDRSFIDFKYGDNEADIINIPRLYAKLFNKVVQTYNINNNDSRGNIEIQNKVNEFNSYLEGKNIVISGKIKKYSKYTTLHSRVETLKSNLLILAKTLGTYMLLSSNYDYITMEYRKDLINLYQHTCELCKEDPTQLVTKEIANEYKRLANMYSYEFLSSKILELSNAANNK